MMKYAEFVKQAYDFKDLRHPDNATANTVAGGVAGAALGGGGAYLLARLLKSNSPLGWGLGGAVAGGGVGALAGRLATDDWTGGNSIAGKLRQKINQVASDVENDLTHKTRASVAMNNYIDEHPDEDTLSRNRNSNLAYHKYMADRVIEQNPSLLNTLQKVLFYNGWNPSQANSDTMAQFLYNHGIKGLSPLPGFRNRP